MMGKIFIGTLLLSWFLIATIEAHGGDFDVPMVKRDEAVNDCERSAAMVALRACRKYCSQNYRKFPAQCGSPGPVTSMRMVAVQMRKMISLKYCQAIYDRTYNQCMA